MSQILSLHQSAILMSNSTATINPEGGGGGTWYRLQAVPLCSRLCKWPSGVYQYLSSKAASSELCPHQYEWKEGHVHVGFLQHYRSSALWWWPMAGQGGTYLSSKAHQHHLETQPMLKSTSRPGIKAPKTSATILRQKKVARDHQLSMVRAKILCMPGEKPEIKNILAWNPASAMLAMDFSDR